MKSKLFPVLMMLAMSCAAALTFTSPSINAQDAQVKLPSGERTLRFHVISRLGLLEAPLKITGLRGDVKKGGTIAAVRLENASGKAVTAVKFAWYLFREQEPGRVLQQGESPVLGVTVSDGEGKVVEYPIVSFGNIYKPLVKDGKLSGDYALEIAVSEIHYENGTKWER